ncbi:tRNA (adenosine(37)-N6)-threonylcarbamoyltransferase complex ATPase subunit type 1 TsaE [Desulfohalovibrio reitneri]|uniref:tRNA (adenosine(37)-N6)-threonylcarbamoyltransferase complex ATPase subunit type 1 TsaE n=1 Tax=Desulfohalovibrio reitneri TaxID=1307759 RepID=UPI0004A71DFC|nr:tRNA (adenosine(37)-N6)-threonylcarbamoyltransferase complex ATPase subunit type 1 TsaE [Desulfohalovibrio reitneri]
MRLKLADERATLALGGWLAECLAERSGLALLLEGPLGSGKTTLVRGLTRVLPGGDQAEVASPSFNIVNIYPTTPEVAHFDLYRLEGSPPGEEYEEWLDMPGAVVAVEWAEYLNPGLLPDDRLTLRWVEPLDGGRLVEIAARGEAAEACLKRLAERVNEQA